MKNLEKNYTTPEQSKRLLELGVPADSADMFYITKSNSSFPLVRDIEDEKLRKKLKEGRKCVFPCWSVGRLIEIYEICFGGYFNSRYFGHTLIEDVLLKIEEQIDSMNFSKLED